MRQLVACLVFILLWKRIESFTVTGPPLSVTSRSSFTLYSTPPDQDSSDDCEDECEVDWSKLFPDEDNAESSLEEEEGDSAVHDSAVLLNTEQMRLRLEMSWKFAESIQDCVVEEPQTCGSDPCETCRGRGARACRFCLGTMRLTLDGSPCRICRKGIEVCRACQGSGWIARWTQYQKTPWLIVRGRNISQLQARFITDTFLIVYP